MLANICNLLKKDPNVLKKMKIEDLCKKALADINTKLTSLAAAGDVLVLSRGVATIPLPGIDVPFHSRQLLGGVPAFRALLTSKLSADTVARELDTKLEHRYIPNVMAEPFSQVRHGP